ncbi:DUF455-domain-containing protein [Auricularia subglabra TFB-10046 SS5]|uniref:DUF455-domain-containing protein n=1 Tax=Auricularia subglabra (strain TFB-10046 / SS5) TaxID=717982 RepID=J0WWQ6_AURST|nr:DUF455-domain-containing protein [Auricularia subglabra TFB-10046 SS5]
MQHPNDNNGRNWTHIGALSAFQSHSRFLLTLRSRTDQSLYKSLILFRLSAADGDDQIYAMESACPHLGADMSHADIEDFTDDAGLDTVVAVCPWHRYDFDLKTGHSETGLRACTYAVQLRTCGDGDPTPQVWIETPDPTAGGWEPVEQRPVSEEFASNAHPPAPTDVPAAFTPANADAEPVVPTSHPPKTLLEWAVLILNTPNPALKVERTRYAVHLFRTGKLKSVGQNVASPPVPPDTPGREAVTMVDPAKTGKRGKAGSLKSRIAILHALANIEQWAIDLAWDIIARFGPRHKELPMAFYSDFTKVALDESKHFSLLAARLLQLGSHYGALTVHAGLWDSAWETRDSLQARLSIIHLVHEARGLDVNPVTIAKFRNAGDDESARVLNIIHCDEVTHVTAGHRWFTFCCARGLGGEGNASVPAPCDPVATFREAVRRHFAGALKGPFNVADRARAGLSTPFYENLHGEWGQLPPDQSATAEDASAARAKDAGPLAFEGGKERALELVDAEGRAKADIAYDAHQS